MVVGCDGIWDCISSQQGVDYFSRFAQDAPTAKLSEAVGHLMDQIIAPDLENCKGIGHDNMTCLVI